MLIQWKKPALLLQLCRQDYNQLNTCQERVFHIQVKGIIKLDYQVVYMYNMMRLGK